MTWKPVYLIDEPIENWSNRTIISKDKVGNATPIEVSLWHLCKNGKECDSRLHSVDYLNPDLGYFNCPNHPERHQHVKIRIRKLEDLNNEDKSDIDYSPNESSFSDDYSLDSANSSDSSDSSDSPESSLSHDNQNNSESYNSLDDDADYQANLLEDDLSD